MDNENIITLIDEENGEEKEFEIIATLKVNNSEYAILLPTDEDTEEGLVFKIVKEDGEEVLEYVGNDEEIEKVAKAYEEMIQEQ